LCFGFFLFQASPLSPNESDIASSVPSVVYKGKSFLQSQLNTIHDSNENNNTDNNDTIEKRADESIFCIVNFLLIVFQMDRSSHHPLVEEDDLCEVVIQKGLCNLVHPIFLV
jgi:hypothetical protein